MMLAQKRHQTFCQADEADAQRALIDYGGNIIIGFELVATHPQSGHQQRKLFGKCGFLELHTFVKLLCSDVEHGIQLGKETCDALLLVCYVHALYGDTDNIDCGERDVSPSDRSLWAEAVFEYTCTASHSSYLVFVAPWVVGFPVFTLVESGVQIQEVWEEATCGYFAGQLVEIVITVFRQVTHAAFLFPYLNGEYSCLAVSYSLICTFQQFANDAATFGRGICSVVDRAEHYLVSSA